MINIILLFISFNLILLEQEYIVSVQEKVMKNFEEGDILPLIVTPTEDVTEEVTITCNGIIRYLILSGEKKGINPDLFDEDEKTKIPSGTKAGTKIKFNCIIAFETKDTNVELEVSKYEDTQWKADENNKLIQLVPIYCVNPISTTSKNLDKNEIIELNLRIMSKVENEVPIEDGTFILKNNGDNSTINLTSCSKIPKEQEIGTINITCKVENEVKEGNYTLELVEGKEIGNIKPMVTGFIYFSKVAEGNEEEDLNTQDSAKNENSGKGCYKLNLFSIWIILLLLL